MPDWISLTLPQIFTSFSISERESEDGLSQTLSEGDRSSSLWTKWSIK